ncbi:hypothetical protein [Plasmodium yoelii yoelii]|uniref:Uncharacterized protein n=1 Tax=Plasmodium yoelii yoelii TaxID=73239 RepID=Q7RF39_PLAYO|nr:hypothetical protein [Plasmodium yoelii yoelii]
MKQDKSQHKQEPFMNTCILDKFDDFVVGFGIIHKVNKKKIMKYIILKIFFN